MEALFTSRLSWVQWLLIAGGLLALYFLIQLLYRLTRRTTILGGAQARIKELFFALQLLFEPMALIVLSISFVFIHPLFCGSFVLLLFLVGFNQFRNYLGGKLVQLNHMLEAGRRLRFQNLNGIISDMGLLGLYMQTREGRHFVSYAQLLTQGYTIVSGTEIGGYYQLKIQNPEKETLIQNSDDLMDILTSLPYLDWNFKPEISEEDPGWYKVKLLVREELHLRELLSLIEERGLLSSLIRA
ncbi:MAG: hypothetical protein AB8H47_22305 [Bacteroidia bacterium]